MDELENWESYGHGTWRMKVNGGHLYQTNHECGGSTVFVPDIDLTRYQAHLRDAYKQGYTDGQADKDRGVTFDFDAQNEKSRED